MPHPLDRRALLRAGTATAAALGLTAAAAGTARAAGSDPVCLRRADVVRWTDRYLAAWQSKDADAAALLFTPDALYQAVPGVEAQTFRGRDAIRAYWSDVTRDQSDLTAWRGTPLVDGDRAVVELWVTLRAGGQWITLIESNVLTFAPGLLCSRNVEYWNLQTGQLQPPPGWGTAG